MKMPPAHGQGIEIEMQTYMPTDAYHSVLDQLERLFATFDPTAPDCLRTRMIMILGEEGGIWPISSFTGEDEGAVIVAA